ncbi:MAG: hypothetical protein GX089_04820 [Fibrobacter sp.]|jgi:hypothetical protein|nr:hypothetical protein [Fibrobacter sp.]HON11336.1 hypothetical protein [Chitinispirillaceae bacterium]
MKLLMGYLVFSGLLALTGGFCGYSGHNGEPLEKFSGGPSGSDPGNRAEECQQEKPVIIRAVLENSEPGEISRVIFTY